MISKIDASNKNLSEAVKEVLEPFGGISTFVKPNDRVFVKPNFNTSDPFPASSDLEFIKASLTIISSQKPKKIILGDSPTYFGSSKHFRKINPWSLEKEFKNLKVMFLNDGPWTPKQIPKGKFLKKASIPSVLDEIDKLILLPCLKTHSIAQFTGSLKLAVGFMKPIERLRLHTSRLQEKIAELNLLIKPDLIIMDGRKCFINKGPSHGKLEKPNLILASTNRVELDIEAIKIIQGYKGNDLNGIDPVDLIQIKEARKLGIS